MLTQMADQRGSWRPCRRRPNYGPAPPAVHPLHKLSMEPIDQRAPRRAGAGFAGTEGGAAASFAPHPVQNLAAAVARAPHAVQNLAAGAGAAVGAGPGGADASRPRCGTRAVGVGGKGCFAGAVSCGSLGSGPIAIRHQAQSSLGLSGAAQFRHVAAAVLGSAAASGFPSNRSSTTESRVTTTGLNVAPRRTIFTSPPGT